MASGHELISAPDKTLRHKSIAPPASAGELAANSVFLGILTTQFLGAFNDNYFKQMVLLKCTEFERTSRLDLQPWAMAAFALPFVLLSGLGGYVSDRFSRQRVIVLCKIGEIIVMSCALVIFLAGYVSAFSQLVLLIAVLVLMGGQSALFGPSKYGILPELFSRDQLLPVNGAVQMTTFLAIIFGMALAGVALDLLGNSLWYASVIAVGIAVTGTLTSLLIRRTPASRLDLPLRPEMLIIPRETWALILRNPQLRNSILVATIFWFVGGVTQPAVNSLGELVFELSKTRTSLMSASIGIGIAAGCIVTGIFSRRSGNGSTWVKLGSWLIVTALLIITLLGSGLFGRPAPSTADEQLTASLLSANPLEWLLRGSMFFLGFSAGAFVVPIQVYIQETPPVEQKGRVLGATNLLSWIGILVSALFFGITNAVVDGFGPEDEPYRYRFLVFAALGVAMLPVAVLYRLNSQRAEL